MKKAKILVPALGMMMLSTAAAVSGTMAWFTANRAVQVTTTSFEVEALDGSLDVIAKAKVGTSVDVATKKIVSITSGYKLGDASFNHTNSTLYTDVPTDDGSQPTSYSVVDTLANAAADNTKWQVGTTTNYYAIAWDLEFTYSFKGDTRPMDLFFDFSHSTCVRTEETAGSGSGQTANGFRIAMICGSEILIWAPNRAGTVSEEAQVYKYVNTTSATANYTNHDPLVLSDTSATLDPVVAADDAAHSTRVDYLAQMTNATPGETNVKTVTCVAWFEGCDPDVINESSMDSVVNTLKFYVRRGA